MENINKATFGDGIRVADPPYSKYIDARIRSGSNSTRDNLSPFEVPEGSLFLIGDNRDNSRDSRNWGAIPQQSVLGRGLVVMFSVRPKEEEQYKWDSILDFPSRVRWERIGTWLQ